MGQLGHRPAAATQALHFLQGCKANPFPPWLEVIGWSNAGLK